MKRAILALAMVAAPGLAGAQEAPRDDATMVVEYREGEGIGVPQLLRAWANTFGALPLVDPALRQAKVRFLGQANKPMTWGTVKAILGFHDIVVLETRAGPNAHWQLQAIQRPRLQQQEGGRYHDAKNLPEQESLITAVFQIEHGAGPMIQSTVRALQARHPNRVGQCLLVAGSEVLIVVDLTSQVRYFRRVVEALDVPGPRKLLEVFQVEHARAVPLAELVQRVLGGLSERRAQRPGGPVVVGPSARTPSGVEIIADERTNRIAVACFSMDLPRIERVIREFDVPIDDEPETTHVYPVKNADPLELEARLKALFQRGAPQGAAGSAAPRPAAVGAGPPSRIETVIVADVPSNRLLIQAEKATLDKILAVLDELDRRPARVHVEVIVYEVSTPTDQMAVGFEIAGLTNAHEGSTRPAGGTAFGLSQIEPRTDAEGNVIGASRIPNVGQGLTAFLTRGAFDRIPILMTAVANYERTRIVERSETTTNDNKQAIFEVSNTIPFLRSDVNNGVTVTTVDSDEATTRITVTPRVNSARDLTLEFELEISTFSGSGTVNLPPGKNRRRYQAEAITVPNSAYAMFGGLDQETDREVESKVPFLGDLPLLGHLFKTRVTDRSRSRLYIFVRPTILDDPEFGATRRIASERLNHVRVVSGHEPWLPAVSGRALAGWGYTLQDEALETFGTGSANPF